MADTSLINKINTPNELITKEEYERRVKEIVKCKRDITYFANTYFKILTLDKGTVNIKLYPKQEELLHFFKNEKRAIALAPRQSGKTVSYTIFCLWQTIFFPEKKVLILANKMTTALEIIERIQRAIENLPKWLSPKIAVWNKGEIVFSNGSGIRGLASSSSAARGMSMNCVTGDTKVTILTEDERIFHTDVDKIANLSNVNKNVIIDELTIKMKYNFVYKTVNLVNGKEYIGVHSTNNLNDGYLGSGKKLRFAIEKYGVENFNRTILEFFDTRDEAYQKEAELVSEEYIARKDTYNMTPGGKIGPILSGELNGFYGKHHSEQTKEKIRKSKTKYFEEHESPLIGKNIFEDDDVIIDGIRYNSYSDAKFKLKLSDLVIMKKILEDNNGYVDEHRQENLKKDYEVLLKEKEINHIHHLEAMKEAAKNPERNKKISNALSGRNHPWQDKINKNPEKIRKMAEKHRGMKRSEEAKQNMSNAKKEYYKNGGTVSNKEKIAIVNLETGEWKYIPKNDEIPNGWKRGMKL